MIMNINDKSVAKNAKEWSIEKYLEKKCRRRRRSYKVSVGRIFQPSLAIVIFCKVNGIEFEEIKPGLPKCEHQKPELRGIQILISILKRAKIHVVLDWHHALPHGGGAVKSTWKVMLQVFTTFKSP